MNELYLFDEFELKKYIKSLSKDKLNKLIILFNLDKRVSQKQLVNHIILTGKFIRSQRNNIKMPKIGKINLRNVFNNYSLNNSIWIFFCTDRYLFNKWLLWCAGKAIRYSIKIKDFNKDLYLEAINKAHKFVNKKQINLTDLQIIEQECWNMASYYIVVNFETATIAKIVAAVLSSIIEDDYNYSIDMISTLNKLFNSIKIENYIKNKLISFYNSRNIKVQSCFSNKIGDYILLIEGNRTKRINYYREIDEDLASNEERNIKEILE